jgi:hypothetical protein
MKKDLTDKQKEIIVLIENQFMALNESNAGVPFNLVDVNKLSAEVNRIKVGKENLKIHNEAIKALRNELAEKLTKQFNEDFERGKLPLDATLNGNGFCSIKFNGYKKRYGCDRAFSLEIQPKSKHTEFGDEYTGEFYFAQSCVAKEKFDTVEGFINSATIQKSFITLIQYVANDAECQRE